MNCLKKRVVPVLLMLAMVASAMLAGCGKAVTSAPTATGSAPAVTGGAPSAVTVDQLDPYNITWYVPGPGDQKDTPAVEDALDKYMKDKINATVDMKCIDWSNYQSKVDAMIAASENFDICFSAGWMGYTSNAVKGAYVQIDDLLAKYAPKTMALFDPKYLDSTRVNGKLYAIPCNTDKAQNYGFLYRKDLADKYGIDMSTVNTWEDILPVLKTVKEKDPTIIPFSSSGNAFPYSNDVDMLNDGANGYVMNNDANDNKVYDILQSPVFMNECKLMRQINTLGYMRKDVLTYQDFDADDNSGKTFCDMAKLKPGVENELNASATVSGIVWAQKAITTPVFSDGTATMMSISRTSKNPERDMMFLELLNTDKYMANLVNYGIEGVDYKKTDDTYIEPIKDSGYSGWIGSQWVLCNQYILYLLPGEDSQKWTKMDAFNKSATWERSSGFTFDPSPVKTQIAAVTNLTQATLPAIKLGVVDPETEIPKLYSQVQSAGESDIITEMQKQWDAYQSSKAK